MPRSGLGKENLLDQLVASHLGSVRSTVQASVIARKGAIWPGRRDTHRVCETSAAGLQME